MSQYVKVFATKSDDPSSNTRIYMVEERTDFKSYCLVFTHVHLTEIN